MADELSDTGWPIIEVSAASHEGLRDWVHDRPDPWRSVPPTRTQPPLVVITPPAVDDRRFTVKATGVGYVVRGSLPERWVRQTDFANDEAVGYLADRLARLGSRTNSWPRGNRRVHGHHRASRLRRDLRLGTRLLPASTGPAVRAAPTNGWAPDAPFGRGAAARVVVKVGSSSLTPPGWRHRCRPHRCRGGGHQYDSGGRPPSDPGDQWCGGRRDGDRSG